jgi:GYF domain 2
MYKIIGADQQEYGPSSADELRQWVREGRADGRSLIKAEGTTEWKPLATFPELAVALAESPFAGQQPPPLTPPSRPVEPQVLASQALNAAPDLQVGLCLRRGWDLLKDNFGLLFFATISVSLVQVFLARIPFIGVLALLFTGVFQGGIYLMFLKRTRGQPAGLGDAWSGFGEHFVQLLVGGIVLFVLTGIGACCCVIPGIYLSVAWAFAIPLIVDKEFRFWDAMELSRKVVTRQWFQMFLLMLVAFLPLILFAACFRIMTFSFAFSLYQSGQLNPSLLSSDPAAYSVQMEHLNQLVTAKFFVWGLIEQIIMVLIQPFARAVLVQAYEILFNPRPAPPA